LHARWNPQAKVIEEWSIDVNGDARGKKFDGRWELWDTDADNRPYMVARLEKDGEFVPLGQWVIKFMYDINPANYDGDMHKVIEALVDKPNRDVERLGDEAFEAIIDYLADLCWSINTPKSRVATMPGQKIVIPQPVVGL